MKKTGGRKSRDTLPLTNKVHMFFSPKQCLARINACPNNSVHNDLYSVHNDLYSVHNELYSVHNELYSIHLSSNFNSTVRKDDSCASLRSFTITIYQFSQSLSSPIVCPAVEDCVHGTRRSVSQIYFILLFAQ